MGDSFEDKSKVGLREEKEDLGRVVAMVDVGSEVTSF